MPINWNDFAAALSTLYGGLKVEILEVKSISSNIYGPDRIEVRLKVHDETGEFSGMRLSSSSWQAFRQEHLLPYFPGMIVRNQGVTSGTSLGPNAKILSFQLWNEEEAYYWDMALPAP